jgi:hypothetical protein
MKHGVWYWLGICRKHFVGISRLFRMIFLLRGGNCFEVAQRYHLVRVVIDNHLLEAQNQSNFLDDHHYPSSLDS